MKSALWKSNKWIKGRNLLKAVYEILIFTQDHASDSTKWMQMCLSSSDVKQQPLQHRDLQTEPHQHIAVTVPVMPM